MASIGLRTAIAHAAVDDAFRASLLSNPSRTCSAAGYKLEDAELLSITEVIAADAFGVSVGAAGNLPALFDATNRLVNEISPAGEDDEAGACIGLICF